MDQASTQQAESQTSDLSDGQPAVSADMRNAEMLAARNAKLAEARKAALAAFRQETGVNTPTPTATSTVEAPAASQTPTQPAVNPADVLAKSFAAQVEQVAAQKAEAARVLAEATARSEAVKAEEARLAELARNPLKLLEAQKISVDQWQARLLNGGEPTAEEKLRAEVLCAAEQARKEAVEAKAQFQQYVQAQQRSTALASLAPAIEREFPMINALVGAETALDALVQESRRTGQKIDPAAFFQEMETKFVNQQTELLRNEQVTSKYKFSVQSSPAVAVASSPQTLSNRVTSTTSGGVARTASDADRLARGRAKLKELFGS